MKFKMSKLHHWARHMFRNIFAPILNKKSFGIVPLAVFAVLLVFLFTRGTIPHTSELAFIETSTLGISAGSVIPASCTSIPPTSHGLNDCQIMCWNGVPYDPYLNPAACPPAPIPPPVIVSFTAPASIVSGTSPQLRWVTTNTTSCTIDQGVGVAAPPSAGSRSASAIVVPTTYTLTCMNGSVGPVIATATIGISASPAPTIITFTGTPIVPIGGSPTLTWSVINVTSCTIDQGVGAAIPATGGSIAAPSILATTLYTITCMNGSTGPTEASTLVTTAQLGVTLIAFTTPLTLPITAFSVDYSLVNGTSADTNCRLLDFSGTPLTAYASCSGSIAHNTPAVAGSYGYRIEADKSGQIARSTLFTVVVQNPIGIPVPILRTNPPLLLNFGTPLLLSPTIRTFDITNTGDVGSTLTGVVTTGDPRFVCTSGCNYVSLIPGGPVHTTTITFTPTIIGLQSTGVLFNGIPSPSGLVAFGGGDPVTISIPAAIDFGTVPITTFKELTIIVTNIGVVSLGTATFTGYSGVYTCVSASTCAVGGINLAPGVENTVVLRYTPTAEGPEPEQLGTLSGQPLYSITINGRGVLPNFKVIEQ